MVTFTHDTSPIDENDYPNRIQVKFNLQEAMIKERIADGRLSQERLKELDSELDMGMEEYVKFQELKTLAVANDTITIAEGMTIYNALGTIPETFNNQPVHIKAVLTTFLLELMQRDI